MTTYYVSVNGNDSNQGSIEHPFSTLRKAINVLKPGDKIYLREGTYYQDKSLWLGDMHSGTTSDRTVISAYPGEKVTIDAWDQRTGNILDIEGDYIDIVGLEIKNSPRHGIGVWGGDHVRIKDNIVHETQKGGIAAHGEVENGIENRVLNLQVEGNTVYRTNLFNQERSASSGWASGINAARANNASIKNNRIYNNYGEGIALTLSVDSVVADNITNDNYSVEIYLDNVRNSVVERNFSYNTGNSNYFREFCGTECQWLPASGIQLANEDYGTTAYSLNDNIIRNNLVVKTRTAFAYGAYETNLGMKNILVANNTFYGSTQRTLFIDDDDDNSNVKFINNIFDQGSRSPVLFLGDQLGLTFENNLLNSQGQQILADSNAIAAPLFRNPGGIHADDYQLQAASQAIDAGIDVDGLSHDFNGILRSVNGQVDIGAYEAPQLETTQDQQEDQGNNSTRDPIDRESDIFNTYDNTLRGDSRNNRLKGTHDNDILLGEGGHDKLTGSYGSDSLNGGDGDDILRGASNNAQSKNSIDILVGGGGRDHFILGNKRRAFYNQRLMDIETSDRDYAIVSDFDKNFDSIQLHGSENSYTLDDIVFSGSLSGKALLYDQNQNGVDSTDELIAVIQTSQEVTLSGQYFSFV